MIEVTGTKNPDSTFTYAVVDAFDVAPQVSATVSITSPPSGAVVSGTIMITVNASGGTVAGVQYRLDGANLGAEVTAAPYSISLGHHNGRQRLAYADRSGVRRRQHGNLLAGWGDGVQQSAGTNAV